jgi:hypothetical protein
LVRPDTIWRRARHAPGLDRPDRGLEGAIRDDRLDRLLHSLEAPVERCGDRQRRLRKADVPDGSRPNPPGELLCREAGAHLALQGQPAATGVLGSTRADAADAARRSGQHDRQVVHREARVDAGADERDAVRVRLLVEHRREPVAPPPWERELLACRHRVEPGAEALEELRRDGLQRRGRRVRYDVGIAGSKLGRHRQRRLGALELEHLG